MHRCADDDGWRELSLDCGMLCTENRVLFAHRLAAAKRARVIFFPELCWSSWFTRMVIGEKNDVCHHHRFWELAFLACLQVFGRERERETVCCAPELRSMVATNTHGVPRANTIHSTASDRTSPFSFLRKCSRAFSHNKSCSCCLEMPDRNLRNRRLRVSATS